MTDQALAPAPALAPGLVAEPGSPELVAWLARFAAALAAPDTADWSALFTDDAAWRDLVATSWTLVTLEGRPAIERMARQQAPLVHPAGFTPAIPAGLGPSRAEGGWFAFETATARATGHVALDGTRATALMTAIQELKHFEEPAGKRRVRGVAPGAERDRRTWLDEREHAARTLGIDEQPYVLVVGGGQNGLSLAARLKRLAVPTLVIEANQAPGDAWRKRYRSLYLHGPSYADHFPFLPFPDHFPLYAAKDKMGEWLDLYAKAMELDIWTGTRCTAARWDEAAEEWVVTVERDGQALTLRPRHLVLATGLSGAAHVPDFPGADSFAGPAYHSSVHAARGAEARGKACVVIGATNSAHDIAQDLWENGAASVTMVQRSPTIVVRIETGEVLRAGSPYANPAIPTASADLLAATVTFKALREMEIATTAKFAEVDADFYRRLEDAGFLLTEGHDKSGFFLAYYYTASGYYIDVGASELVASGEIKVARGSVAEILPHGVRLDDGTVLPAEVLVYATGYRPLEEWVGQLISPDVQARIGPCWGLGSGAEGDPGPWQGELRNMYKPTAQDGLWFQAGNVAQARFGSSFLALQLKARFEGLPTPVYATEPARTFEPTG